MATNPSAVQFLEDALKAGWLKRELGQGFQVPFLGEYKEFHFQAFRQFIQEAKGQKEQEALRLGFLSAALTTGVMPFTIGKCTRSEETLETLKKGGTGFAMYLLSIFKGYPLEFLRDANSKHHSAFASPWPTCLGYWNPIGT